MSSNAYAVITEPDKNGRNGWEQFCGYGYAKQMAAFYRYTYGYTTEVWSLRWTPQLGLHLGKCLKREIVDDTHPYRGY